MSDYPQKRCLDYRYRYADIPSKKIKIDPSNGIDSTTSVDNPSIDVSESTENHPHFHPDARALISAAGAGDIALVSDLIAAGAPINVQDADGFSPLAIAAIFGHQDIVDLLLNAKASYDSIHKDLLDLPSQPHRDLPTDPLNMLLCSCTHFRIEDRFRRSMMHHVVSQNNVMLTKAIFCDQGPLHGVVAGQDHSWLLHAAASKGYTRIVKILLDARAYVDIQNSELETPLITAVKYGHIETVETLIAAGASLLSRNRRGATALVIAAKANNAAIMRTLLSRDKEGLNDGNVHGETPLDIAVYLRCIDTAQVLFEAGANVPKGMTQDLFCLAVQCSLEMTKQLLAANADPNASLHMWAPPLILASSHGDINIVNELLNAKADITKCQSGHRSAIISAATKGHTNVVKLLLKARADVQVSDAKGMTPLMHAVNAGDPQTVDALIKAGAQVDAVSNIGETALMLAAASGDAVSIKLLISANVDVNFCNGDGRTALLSATQNGKLEALLILIEADADVNATSDGGGLGALWRAPTGEIVEALIAARANVHSTDKVGSTVLMNAASKGRVEALRALIKAGACINDMNYSGDTALHEALTSTDVSASVNDIVEALLGASADVNCVNRKNETILHIGALNHNIHAVILEMLLDAGAPVNHQNFEGKTALHIALEKNSMEKVQLLISRGADLDIRDHQGMTPLVRSAKNLNTAAVQALLAAGARWHAGHMCEIEVFRYVCWTNRDKNSLKPVTESEKIIELLIAAKADVNPKQRSRTPLVLAAAKPVALKLLLDAHARVDARSSGETTALLAAAKSSQSANIELLLNAKASVNAIDCDNYTPLRYAVSREDSSSAQRLIDAGANVDQRFSIDECLISDALLRPSESMLELLLDAKADVNKVVEYHARPVIDVIAKKKQDALELMIKAGLDLSEPRVSADVIHEAVSNDNSKMLRMLLEGKANVNAGPYGGRKTPLMTVLTSNRINMDIFNLLLDAGARVEDCVFKGETVLGSPGVLFHTDLFLKPLLIALCKQTGYHVPLKRNKDHHQVFSRHTIDSDEPDDKDEDKDEDASSSMDDDS